MTRHPIARVEGPAVALPLDNIDTDQIIPARFLKTTTRDGLGAHLFDGWRRGAGTPTAVPCVLDLPAGRGARVLVAGQNFGCGSSREHAPWALLDFGFGAVVAGSFADIFRQNALKNGLLPVAVPAAAHAEVLALVTAQPGTRLLVDLERQVLTWPSGQAPFAIDPFARECLLEGVDEIGYVLRQEAAIGAFEARLAG
jgi:3-isopropylmalate/(R)-2-methylmalate dehydratase small subunit